MISTVEYLIKTIGLPAGVKKVTDATKVFDIEILFSDGSYEAGIKRVSCVSDAIEYESSKNSRRRIGRMTVSPITNRINKSGKSVFLLIDATRIRTG